jgi:hypothetical protein
MGLAHPAATAVRPRVKGRRVGWENGRGGPAGLTERLGPLRRPDDLTYRGQDRRAPASWTSPRGRQLSLAVTLLLTVTAVVAYLAARDATPPGVDLRALDGVLASASATVAVVAGFVSCLRWRMVGNAASLRTGAALLLLGAFITFASLVPFVGVSTPSSRVLERLDAAMALTVLALLTVAVVAPPINTRVSAARRLFGVIAAVACLWALLYVAPTLTDFGRSSRAPFTGVGEITARGLVIAVWVPLGLISIARGMRRTSWLWTWLGLMLFGFAIADALDSMATMRDDLWTTGGLIVRLLALLFALNGVGQELKLAFLDQRSRLFDTRLSAEASEVRRRAEQAEREERAHDARSALFGIQAATRTLTAGYGGYATEMQTEFRDALEAEIELLRHLVDADRVDVPCEVFDVAAAVSAVVVCQRAAGRDIRTELGPGLCALGHAAVLTEIVQTSTTRATTHPAHRSQCARSAPAIASRSWSRTGVRAWPPTAMSGSSGVAFRHRVRAVAWDSTSRVASSATSMATSASRTVPAVGQPSWSRCRPPHRGSERSRAHSSCTSTTTLETSGIRIRSTPRGVTSEPTSSPRMRSGSCTMVAVATPTGGSPLVTTTSNARSSVTARGSSTSTISRSSRSSARASSSPSSAGATAMSTRRSQSVSATPSGDRNSEWNASPSLMNRQSSNLTMPTDAVRDKLSRARRGAGGGYGRDTR